MGLYHLHVKNISRGDGRSVVAAAAYRAGATLENAAEERLSKFAGRRDVLGAEIHLPAGAPAWMADRATLWNAVEAIETRKDARLAKEIEFSIPRELPRAVWFEVARAMADHYTAQGLVVDIAVHDDGTGHNPHVHLLMTTRAVTAAGFGQKLRAADHKSFLIETRLHWQRVANAALAKAGVAVKIDASSYAARGIEREPGEHLPPDLAARRQRRDEVAAMLNDSEIMRAREALLAEPDIKDRYPILSGQPDWPPRQRPVPSLLSNETTREQARFWQEIDDRAAGPQQAQELPQDERSLDDEVSAVFRKVQSASLKEGDERREAFVEGAREYQRLYDRMNGEMMKAGLIKPENMRDWESISRAFRDPSFDQMLAEARALEARRNAPDRTLRATPEMVARLERIEREEEERRGVAFTPGTGNSGTDEPGVPHLPPRTPARMDEPAQTRMLKEYEREPAPGRDPADAQAHDRPADPFAYLARTDAQPEPVLERARVAQLEADQPLDPFDWLNKQLPLPPTPPPDQADNRDEREHERDEDRWAR